MVTRVDRLVKLIRLHLRSVHLAALYLNEVISMEKMGTVSSDN